MLSSRCRRAMSGLNYLNGTIATLILWHETDDI
jgi:hypothetical protein